MSDELTPPVGIFAPPMMSTKVDDFEGTVVKKDDRYRVTDNTSLKTLTASQTVLNVGKSTTGHRHPGQEEIYFFINGIGSMAVGNEDTPEQHITGGDIVFVPDGAFHKVTNNGPGPLVFVVVLAGPRTI